jgi:hypothetical protein
VVSDDTPAAPAPSAAPAQAPAPPPVRRRWPLVLLLGVVAAVVIGLTAGIYLYTKVTEPDRSSPSVSVQQFLTAVFVDTDQGRTGLFTCSNWSARTALETVTAAADPNAHISWDTVVTEGQSGGEADVSVRMRFRYAGDVAPSGEQTWRFHVVRDNGWRVCGFVPTVAQ